jgi:uncharacterized protein (DUF433 family)
MTTLSEHWLVPEIERLARSGPDRIEGILQALRSAAPEVHCELVLMALDNGNLSQEEAASRLGTDEVTVAIRLELFRQSHSESNSQTIVHDKNQVARIANKHVAVWEIVREFRRAGSVGAMRDSFPTLTELELRTALAYAGRHPDEIAGRIAEYERLLERSRSLYPFDK